MENYKLRYCCNTNCTRKIESSNGGVLVRDLIEFMETGKKPEQIRELCGICSIKIDPRDIK